MKLVRMIALQSALLLGGLMVAEIAQADVSGIWRGYGEWTYEGSGTPCRMAIQYEETATALKRVKGYFDCQVVALHSDPLAWQKQGSDLVLDGKKSGTIAAQGFEAREDYGDEGVKIVTKFTLDAAGTTAKYLELWYDKFGAEMYVIRGSFKKSRN